MRTITNEMAVTPTPEDNSMLALLVKETKGKKSKAALAASTPLQLPSEWRLQTNSPSDICKPPPMAKATLASLASHSVPLPTQRVYVSRPSVAGKLINSPMCTAISPTPEAMIGVPWQGRPSSSRPTANVTGAVARETWRL